MDISVLEDHPGLESDLSLFRGMVEEWRRGVEAGAAVECAEAGLKGLVLAHRGLEGTEQELAEAQQMFMEVMRCAECAGLLRHGPACEVEQV